MLVKRFHNCTQKKYDDSLFDACATSAQSLHVRDVYMTMLIIRDFL